MSEKVFAKGVSFLSPRENAPSYVKGTVIINLREFTDNVANLKDHYKEYKSEKMDKPVKQLHLVLKESKEGRDYLSVDTFKPDPNYRKQNGLGSPKEAGGIQSTAKAGTWVENDDDTPF